MRWYTTTAASLALAAGLLGPGYADAQQFHATLSGLNEVGGSGGGETGPILSAGTGTLQLTLDQQAGTLNYQLNYGGTFSSTVGQSHIHFAPPGVAGGIVVFLCTNLGNGPTGTPACPPAPGSVSGTLTAANVVADAGQNIPAMDFAALVTAITTGHAYANIHTANFLAGEIRGQVKPCQGQGDGEGNGGGCQGQGGD